MADSTTPTDIIAMPEQKDLEDSIPSTSINNEEELDEELLDDELEEELIIEDFTIDGICGVY